MKKKYPIKKEFFPYSVFNAPSSKVFLRFARVLMKAPRFFTHPKGLGFQTFALQGKEGETFRLHYLSQKDSQHPLPLLYFIHGGGFIYESSLSHYKMALTFARALHINVAYLQYNLAPDYPFPYPQEEAYAGLSYIVDHAKELNIDVDNIGLMGDSCGGTLCTTSIILASMRELEFQPRFLLLLYPWLDNSWQSSSYQKYVDTPMWSSRKNKSAGRYTNPQNVPFPPEFVSPCHYKDLSMFPNTYIEVAEFDPLHDDGVLFSKLLQEAGKSVSFEEVRGTMHGYDTKWNAPTVQQQIKKRLSFASISFYGEDVTQGIDPKKLI